MHADYECCLVTYFNETKRFSTWKQIFALCMKGLSMLRLVLLAILNAKFDDFLILFGLVCSSFVTISKGTHWRCPTYPLGLETVSFVRHGNEFTAKTLTLKEGCQKSYMVKCW